MKLEPRAQRLIRSTSHWVLGLTVVSAGLALFGVSQIPKNPLPNLVWAAVAGWVAFTIGRAGYVLSRPPSPATLKQGVLALRSYFRALVVSGALAVVVMGLGTAALTSLVAISSTTARRMAVLSSGSMHGVATMLSVLQILVGVLILLFSLGLLGVTLPLRS